MRNHSPKHIQLSGFVKRAGTRVLLGFVKNTSQEEGGVALKNFRNVSRLAGSKSGGSIHNLEKLVNSP